MPTNQDLAEMRNRYMQGGLLESQCAPEPSEQFAHWLDQAIESSPGEWFEANAMTLSTATTTGEVSSRIVLLKGMGEDGLRFYTNYASHKGRQLADNPRAALNFFWPHLERQVRVEGTVGKLSREASAQYFHSRPRESQLGALASRQSEVIANRESLVQRFEAEAQRLEGQQTPLPEDWGGYVLAPTAWEFWQGRTGRLHDRLRYTHRGGAWVLQRLAP